jgi:peptide/nickel transport system substrate-binding protein
MVKAGPGRGAPSRRWLQRFLPLLPLLPLFSCAAGGQGGQGDEETVLVASGAELQSINPLITVHPFAKQVQKHVLFLTVAAYDSALVPVPRLATWDWSDGHRTLTLRLRRDVRWQDDVPTTAADVAWTLRQARDPAVAYPRAGELAGLARVEPVDSFTVVLRFRAPQPVFPDVLTDLAILPTHCFAGLEGAAIRGAPFNAAPVGNGPFAFVEHRPTQRWVFRRRDDFPADLGRPAVERFVVAIVSEPMTKLAALTAGELDMAGITAAHVAFARRDPNLRVLDYPLLLVYGVVFNVRRAPFDEPAVRRALSRAIDRRLIVRAYLYGFGTPAAGPVSPDHPWYEPVPDVPFDTAAARRLLDSAGWRLGPDGVRARGGRRLAFDLMTVGAGDMALEQMLQAEWRAIGVEARIRQRELSTFLATAQGPARDFDALVTGVPGDLALGHVAALYDGDGPLAYPGYASPALDSAFAQVRRAEDPDALVAAWRAVQRVLARDEPTAWIYHARGVQGLTRRLAGVRMDLRGELVSVARWRLTTGPTDGARQ